MPAECCHLESRVLLSAQTVDLEPPTLPEGQSYRHDEWHVTEQGVVTVEIETQDYDYYDYYPDLVAPTMKDSANENSPRGTDDFYWNSAEEGGGFTFSYVVQGDSYLIEELIPDEAKIQFFWAETPQMNSASEITDLAFELELGATEMESGVEIIGAGSVLTPEERDLKSPGKHTIRVMHVGMKKGSRTPVIDNLPNEQMHYLVMSLDPPSEEDEDGVAWELDEENNLAALKIVPLVVNVVTHGFLPYPDDPESPVLYQALANTLEEVPEPDSILEGRVTSLVPSWDSTTLFRAGFGFLMAAKIADVEATLLLDKGDLTSAFQLQMLAETFEKAAAGSAYASDLILESAVGTAFSKLFDPAQDLLIGESPEMPELRQHVNLVGHSRGAMFNAVLASQLAEDETSPISVSDIDYVSLDGYAADWSTPSGANSSNGILSKLRLEPYLADIQGAQQNFRVSTGLELDPEVLAIIIIGILPADVLNELWATNDIRAPNRQLGGADPIVGGTHTTITESYLDKVDLAIDNLDQTELKGFLWDYRDNVEAESQSSPFTVPPERIADGSILGFVDGQLEELGELWSSIQATSSLTTGIEFLDQQLQLLRDPMTIAGLYWEVAGDVRIRQASGNTSLELRQKTGEQTTLAQLIEIGAEQTSIDFNLSVLTRPQQGTLDILLDDSVLQSINLAQAADGRFSVALPTDTEGMHRISFRLSAAGTVAGSIALDDFAVCPTSANAAPVLGGTSPVSNYAPELTPVVIASNATLSDSDTPVLDGGRISVTVTTSMEPSDQIQIRHTGTAAGQTSLDGNKVLVSGIEIGTWSGGLGAVPLVVELNSAATLPLTQILLRNVTFSSTNPIPSTTMRQISFRVWDGQGSISVPQVQAVNVLPANRPPVVTAKEFLINENSVNGAFIGTIPATDPDAGQSKTFAITAGNTNNAFAIHPTTGTLTVNNSAALNYETVQQFNLTVTVTDNGNPQKSGSAPVKVLLKNVNEGPAISGLPASQIGNDSVTITPFAAMTVTDPDHQNMLARVTILNGVVRGDFTAATTNGWTRTVAGNNIVYNRFYNPAANIGSVVQAALRGFVFVPRSNAIKPNTTELTDFTVFVNDGVASTTTTTRLTTTSVNNAPVIGGASNTVAVNDNATVNPFPSLTVTDADMQEMLISVTILNGTVRGDFTAASTAGWAVRYVLGNNITYKRYFSPQLNVGAAAQAAFRTLVFQPRQNAIKPGTTEATDFQVTASDGVAPAIANSGTRVTTTSVNNAPAIGGAVANQTMNDSQTKAVFGTLTVTDPDTQDQFVRITITNGTVRGDFTAASTVGWTRKTSGANILYERFFAAAANNGAIVQAAIRALVFQPRTTVPVGTQETTSFTVFVNDGLANATNSTTSVVTTGVAPRFSPSALAVPPLILDNDISTVVLPTGKKSFLARQLKKSR